MRIVTLTNYGLNSNGGGVKVYTKNLVNAILKKGIKVMLIIREGVPVEAEEKLPSNKFIYMAKATGRLKKLKPELVLSQGGWFTAIPAMIYKIRYPSAKVAYIYHTYYNTTSGPIQRIIRIAERFLMSFVLSKFDVVFFVSKGLRVNVEENGALKILPNWKVLYGAPTVNAPTQEEIEEFTKEFKILSNRFYVLAHGLTAFPIKAKGAKLLLNSLRFLPQNVVLILTRKGSFVDELKRYAKIHGILDRVIFTGNLENPHTATEVSHVYAHITYGEGLPLALLEVMSIGKPIVASRVGGIPEAIRHPLEGILVGNDVKEISNAILFLLENPRIMRKMSIISKRAVAKRFSWERTAVKLVQSLFSKDDSNDHNE
ncbi:glycosyltransferase family 4 protein [Thermococcus sp.]|uniref:glycosyltransferase family 4 protein n=1 Tax=Thermococcus sp. TaxID=35749 RepID=UPI00260C699F|nr:glycosyltransferase family 4 protein [Thermococcus sp.]